MTFFRTTFFAVSLSMPSLGVAQTLQELTEATFSLTQYAEATLDEFSVEVADIFPGVTEADSKMGEIPQDFSAQSWSRSWGVRINDNPRWVICTRLAPSDINRVTLRRLNALSPEDSIHLRSLRMLRFGRDLGPDDPIVPDNASAVLMCNFTIVLEGQSLTKNIWVEWLGERFDSVNPSHLVGEESATVWGLIAEQPSKISDVFLYDAGISFRIIDSKTAKSMTEGSFIAFVVPGSF
jgi:hypothetical protein